jgi:chromate transporter
MDTPFSIFRLFFYLGCISFGGPAAHIALFQTKIIDQKAWMSAEQYLQLVALCQFLPGPSSSQVGMGLGLHRAGYLGAFASWLGFTLPSAILMYLLASLLLVIQCDDFKRLVTCNRGDRCSCGADDEQANL